MPQHTAAHPVIGVAAGAAPLTSSRWIVMMGLSRGGTTHYNQMLHASPDAAAIHDGVSRLVRPSRDWTDQLIAPAAVCAATLWPRKDVAAAKAVSMSKVNYSLTCTPDDWARFLAEDRDCDAVILLRNPFMVHRSRVSYVRRHRPQRFRWLDAAQLAHEMRVLLAMAWRLPRAVFAVHERALENRHANVCTALGLRTPERDWWKEARPHVERRERPERGGEEWLYDTRSANWLEGHGNYNYARTEDPSAYRDAEEAAFDEPLAAAMRDSVGGGFVEFFRAGAHWADDAAVTIRELVDADPERWAAVDLRDRLHPY